MGDQLIPNYDIVISDRFDIDLLGMTAFTNGLRSCVCTPEGKVFIYDLLLDAQLDAGVTPDAFYELRDDAC